MVEYAPVKTTDAGGIINVLRARRSPPYDGLLIASEKSWRVERMTQIYVQYRNHRYDVVEACWLDKLIADKKLRRFYRRSEERWVNVDSDPIRGPGGDYSGPERRQSLYGLSW